MSDEHAPTQVAKPLALGLWFPLFFAVGFMLCYLVPFHSPTPTDMPVAVAGQQPAAAVSMALEDRAPDSFDIAPADSAKDARRAVEHRDAVAGYSPEDHELYVAGSLGRSAQMAVQQTFAPIAARDHAKLTLTDVAPTSSGDSMGNALFYLVLPWNLASYIAVMMLAGQAPALARWIRILALAGFGLLTSGLCYLVGVSMDIIPNEPWVLAVAFLLTQAVALPCLALAPLTKRAFPGVAMGLFVLLSLPSSGGAIPVEMVPRFFQAFHPVMPMGQAIEAIRNILYFDGARLVWPLSVLGGWILLGAGLLTIESVRARRDQRRADAESRQARTPPALIGRVVDPAGRPVGGAVVTVTDQAGARVDTLETDSDGSYRSVDLPEERLTLLATASGHAPRVARAAPDPDGPVHIDFTLNHEEGHAAEHARWQGTSTREPRAPATAMDGEVR